MWSVSKSVRLAGAIVCGMAMVTGAASAQERAASTPQAVGAGAAVNAPPVAPGGLRPAASAEGAPAQPAGAWASPADPTALGKQLLNAGPDPRVRLDGKSRDHAAIFGTDDEDEQALLDQERALQAQRDQLKVLERVLNAPPQGADPHPPAMIPLTSGRPVNMPQLLPTPSGSQLDQGRSETRRSVDEMQRRVNGLRRDADTLRQGGR